MNSSSDSCRLGSLKDDFWLKKRLNPVPASDKIIFAELIIVAIEQAHETCVLRLRFSTPRIFTAQLHPRDAKSMFLRSFNHCFGFDRHRHNDTLPLFHFIKVIRNQIVENFDIASAPQDLNTVDALQFA